MCLSLFVFPFKSKQSKCSNKQATENKNVNRYRLSRIPLRKYIPHNLFNLSDCALLIIIQNTIFVCIRHERP